MNVGLPLGIAVLVFLILYTTLSQGVSWISAIAMIGGALCVVLVVDLAIARLAKRFIRA
jgi:nicotinamide riboside transporter PnuC